MYRADKLYNDMMAVDTAIKQLKVEDEASLAEYFRLYTELIFNHKWIGSIYDIYSDNADIYRENGLYLHGAHEMMKDTLKLTSAFPDMQVTMRDTFAVKRDDGYKLCATTPCLEPTRLTASMAPPPTSPSTPMPASP